MSRCKACNTMLNDYDLKRKDKSTGEYLDLCGMCYSESQAALYDAQSDTQVHYLDDLPLDNSEP